VDGLHIFCRHEAAKQGEGDETRLRELEILAGQYRLGVETQMHFNELILRTRSMGMYGAILVMGGALLLRSQYPTAAAFDWNFGSGQFPVFGAVGPVILKLSAPALISLFGPVLLAIVWLMDRKYYLSLLGGASRYVYQIEDRAKEIGISLAGVPGAFGQGRTIQYTFGPRLGASTKYVNRAYFLVGLAEAAVIFFLVTHP
jgi:hypothetical protein